jgi:hypothetical protein
LQDSPEHEYYFDQYGEYQQQTPATQTIIPEEEFFAAVEYDDFNGLVDDILESLHPERVSVE